MMTFDRAEYGKIYHQVFGKTSDACQENSPAVAQRGEL
jgi:hypothetical protein